MDDLAKVLKLNHVQYEYHSYPQVTHGSGLGLGTNAEQWFNHAVRFVDDILKEADLKLTQ